MGKEEHVELRGRGVVVVCIFCNFTALLFPFPGRPGELDVLGLFWVVLRYTVERKISLKM